MQANDTQRNALLEALVEIVQGKARLIDEADEHDDEEVDSFDDYVNTMQVLLAARTAFKDSGDVKALCEYIRGNLDTMVYEDVFDALEDMCSDVEGLDDLLALTNDE